VTVLSALARKYVFLDTQHTWVKSLTKIHMAGEKELNVFPANKRTLISFSVLKQTLAEITLF